MDLQQIETKFTYLGYAESRIGGRGENQDSYGFQDTPFGLLVTVCDGMGGGPGGKTASEIAVREITQGVMDANSDDTPSNILMKAVRRANMAIIQKCEDYPKLKGMGSTCTALLINDHSAILAYVGDSRIYQLRGHRIVYRTFDHSMVFDLVKQKVITEEQARLSAQSNIITRSLGSVLDVKIDIVELPYEKGDRFMLCTDGIHGTIPESELISMATNRKATLGQIADEIATRVDGEGRINGGGHDNLTLVILETENKSTLKNKMSKRQKLLLYILTAVCVISIGCNIYFLCSDCTQEKEATEITNCQDSSQGNEGDGNPFIEQQEQPIDTTENQ